MTSNAFHLLEDSGNLSMITYAFICTSWSLIYTVDTCYIPSGRADLVATQRAIAPSMFLRLRTVR